MWRSDKPRIKQKSAKEVTETTSYSRRIDNIDILVV